MARNVCKTCGEELDSAYIHNCPGKPKIESKPLSVILDEIEQLADNATAGPWCLNWGNILANGISTRVCQAPEGENLLSQKWRRDKEFIASARTDVPALVKALRRAIVGFYVQQGSSVMGRYPKIGQKALDDITAILNQRQQENDTK